MAHTVYLGSFTKKLNSTAQPSYSGWSSYSCSFKEETSLYSPTLRLTADWASLASANYNYAVMQSRYYWIRDIRAIRTNYVEVDLQLDPLATYKSRITATSAFIEYGFNSFDAGASGYRVADNRIAVSENPSIHFTQKDVTGGLVDELNGCYILQAVGNNSNGAHKGLATFALTSQNLRDLMASVNGTVSNTIDTIIANPNALTPQEIANQIMSFSLKQELLNESAMSAIQSIQWLPFDIDSASGTPGTTIYLGNFSTNVQALMLSQNSIYHHIDYIDIPWPVDDWRRNNCQMLLYMPFFGTIPLPIDQCINCPTVGINWTAEYFSGSISVVVRVNNGSYVVYAGSTNVSVDMGIGRSSVGISGLMGGTIQMLGGTLQMAGGIIDATAGAAGSLLGLSKMSDAAAGIASGLQSTYSGYAQTVQPVITCAGSMGGMAAIGQDQRSILTLLYYPPIDAANFQAKYGHPVFEMGTPVSGFCKTRGFSVSGSMPGNYAAVINSAMDGGVYIE